MKSLNIKKLAAVIACVVTLGFASPVSAIQLLVGDLNYLGSIKDGVPPGDNEILWVNIMAGLAPNGSSNFVQAPNINELIERSGNDFGSLNAATSGLKHDNDDPDWTILGNSLYLAGKYGKGQEEQLIHVWYVGNLAALTEVSIDTVNLTLSHSTMFSGERTTRVPDGGSTLALIGLAVAGLGFMRRKMA